MSVFTEPTTPTTEPPVTQTTEPTPTTTQTQESFVAKLIADKGETFSNPEVVAKSKLEADAFISNLEKQNSELREDLNKQKFAEELLTTLQDKTTQAPNVTPVDTATPLTNPGGTSSDTSTKVLESGDIESLIANTLDQRAAQTKTDTNLKFVDDKLNELYGTEAEKKIEAKGEELGLSKDYLKSMAAESPQAFFALIGEEARKVVNPVTQSTVNTAGVYNHVADRDYAFYRKLRKENPRDYFSPKVQKAMLADAERLGDKFGLD